MTAIKVHAPLFPFVVYPWGRFLCFLLCIGSDEKMMENFSLSCLYFRCAPLPQFLVNRQQWERYITTQPNPSPRKTKGWQLSPGGPRYQAYQKPAEDVWEYSAQFGRGWNREIVRLGIIDVGQQPPTEPGRIHVQEAAEGYWEREGARKNINLDI